MIRAKIIKSSQRDFQCINLENKNIFSARAKGNLLKGDFTVAVGDIVQIEEISDDPFFQIVLVEKRKNEIFRIFIREARKKVIAANCDVIVIITSVSNPAYKRGIIDRFLLRSLQWGIDVICVFNKMDQYKPTDFDITFEEKRLNFSLNYKIDCYEISAKNPSYQFQYLKKGIDDLRNDLKGKTALVVGQSGVGKSHTISTLTERKINLKTQEVGKVGKGIHTTTWSEIIDCGLFDLIDSPGIRSFSLDDIREQELDKFYPDLTFQFSRCKFSNCKHLSNSVGCSLHEWYSSDSEENKLKLSRLESYLKIKEEIAELPDWKKKDY